MKWINVKKQLPRVGQKVIVHLEPETVLMGTLYENGWACFYADGEEMCKLTMPTHWIEIPPSPIKVVLD